MGSFDRPMTPADTVVSATAVTARTRSSAGPLAAVVRRRWFRVVLVAGLVVSALLLYASLGGWSGPSLLDNIQLFTVARRSFPVVLREKGEIKAANSIEIRSQVEGRATIIYLVDEGIIVKKGDLLVELASDEIDEAIREHEIRVATAKAAYEAAVKSLEILQDEDASKVRKADLDLRLAEMNLEKFKEGEAVELRQDAILALKKAESLLDRYTETLKDSELLYKQKFLTKIELENDRFNKLAAELDQKKAQLAQDVLDKYTIPMGLQERESAVTEARKELERAKKSSAAQEDKGTADVAARKSELGINEEKLARHRDQKVKSKIFAPADGLVVYARTGSWYRTETQVTKGAQVFEQQTIIELPDTRTMKAVIRVHEAQTQWLKRDLPATVEIEGFTGRVFTGRVSKIAALADSQNRWLNPNLKEYETEIMLDGEFTDLKPGISCRADILIVELKDVVAIPVQAVFAKGASCYAFVDHGGRVEPAKIVTGMSSNEYVEVKQGLEPGQKVYLAITEEMKLLLPDEGNDAAKAFRRPAAEPAKKPAAAKEKKK